MTTMSPDFAIILRDALGGGHHAAAAVYAVGKSVAEIAEYVIDVAESEVFELSSGLREDYPGQTRLTITRGFAAILYTSEQELLMKVDALEERLENLRVALTELALVNRFETLGEVRQFAKAVLVEDDAEAAADDAPPKARPPKELSTAELLAPDEPRVCDYCGMVLCHCAGEG